MSRISRLALAIAIAFVAVFGFAAQPTQAATPTIAEIVVDSCNKTGEFCTLLAAVKAADPAVLATLSNPSASLTVFAPTNNAFAILLKELGLTAEQLLANKALVTQVLLYHVLPSKRDAASLIASSQAAWPDFCIDTALAVSGVKQPLQFTLDSDTADGKPRLIVNASTVQTANIGAANGIVHVIDRVLLFGNNVLANCGRAH